MVKKEVKKKAKKNSTNLLPFKTYGFQDRIKYFFIIFFLAAALDQAVKLLVILFLSDTITIIPQTLFLHYVENTGAAFGMMSGASLYLGLLNLLIIVLILILNFVLKLPKEEYISLALIAGGALGNAVDRIFFGSVIDFIDLGWWPVFNIADTCIVIGFIWLFWILMFKKD